MPEIVIRISVPEGVVVRVDGNNHQSSERAFVAREPPQEPDGYCPVHDSRWRLVPAGTSKKSGKRYNAFWACPERGCNERPGRDTDAF